jgi:cellobiose phosphorylase
VTRKFRGATYNIEIVNPNGSQKGIKALYVNGKKVAGNLVPMAKSGEIVDVKAEM